MFLFKKSQENRDLYVITVKFIVISLLINYLVLNEVRFNFNSIYYFVVKQVVDCVFISYKFSYKLTYLNIHLLFH